MKSCYRVALVVAVMGVLALSGCKSTSMRCVYTVGSTDTVTYSTMTEYKTWVKMPDKEATKPDMRQTATDLVLKRTVKTVDPNGTAVMEVTFESVKLAVDTDVREKATHKEYVSAADKNSTDWPGEPALAGKSYQIRIAPDSTVLAAPGLDEVRKSLNLGAEASGVAASLLDLKHIKTVHEREFVQYGPAKISGKSATYQKELPTPDTMIKAKAIRKTFTIEPQADGALKVTSSVEPLHVLPAGMAEPEEPNNFGQTLIKDKSDMQELTIVNEGLFNAAAGKIKSETITINCLLILDGDKLGFGEQNKEAPKGSGGEMFTTINTKTSFKAE